MNDPIHQDSHQDSLRRRLAANARAARRHARLTLKLASTAAQMHWRHWQKIEAAEVNVTLDTLTRVGRALGIDPVRLLVEPKAA
jgi:hypothetical protein